MRLGISLPLGSGEPPDGDVISRGARAAEENGFDSVWFFDSVGRGRFALDPLIGVAVAAAATQRIEVGIGILQVPIRHPVELANRVLTAQLVCEGRLLLGVGSGSTRVDFDAVGKNFDDRMSLLNHGLATMRRLWNGRTADGVSLNPAPAVWGGPPVIIGSWAGPRWIAAAAEEYEGLDSLRLLLRLRHAESRYRPLPRRGRRAGHRHQHLAGPRCAHRTPGRFGQRFPPPLRPRRGP